MTSIRDEKIIQELRKFDTATICNVVATYPDSDICLKLYDSWRGEYYTDTSIRCIYPEYGPVCGYAATAWYSDETWENTKLDSWLLYEHLEKIKRPVVLVAKQTYSPGLENLSGLFGGMMTTEFKAFGVVGVLTDGPMRDYVEIKESGIQYLATGMTSGHGPVQLRGAGIPVNVAGLSVSPGEIIHMDQCGACKFPAEKLPKVLEYATELIRRETDGKKRFQDQNFSLKRWKEEVQGKRAEK
ncbi:MAG TPA: RraA family protein [Nitrososphaerales archaeon]|nr:RraA family protein [Nitrososphaerales archaeon]